ncbi:hypothetical protein BSKO_05270 [Bryopsis sp. KO-2023]|nr:hypothetical protein BSKO_05270 [Bryopsis sp. KO-2023]
MKESKAKHSGSNRVSAIVPCNLVDRSVKLDSNCRAATLFGRVNSRKRKKKSCWGTSRAKSIQPLGVGRPSLAGAFGTTLYLFFSPAPTIFSLYPIFFEQFYFCPSLLNIILSLFHT